MIIALLLSIPWWAAILAYFAIGAGWACLYLPRAVKRQAKRYSAWRDDLLHNHQVVSVKELLGCSVGSESSNATNGMTPERFRRCQEENNFTERYIIRRFIADIAFWPLRLIAAIVFDYLSAVWRAAKRFCRYIWRDIVVRSWRWVYSKITTVYQRIISLANREAIADLKMLEPQAKGEK